MAYPWHGPPHEAPTGPVAGWVCPICGSGVSPMVPEHCSRATGAQVQPVLIDSPIQRLSPVDLAAIRSRQESQGPPGPGSLGGDYGERTGTPGPAIAYGVQGMQPPPGGWPYGGPTFAPPPPVQFPSPTLTEWNGFPWITFHADDLFAVNAVGNMVRKIPIFYLSTFYPPHGSELPHVPPVTVEVSDTPLSNPLPISAGHARALALHYEYLADAVGRALEREEAAAQEALPFPPYKPPGPDATFPATVETFPAPDSIPDSDPAPPAEEDPDAP